MLFTCMCWQREEAELQRLEEEKAAEEKRRQRKTEKDRLDESLRAKRAAQMKQEQEELAFDRKILEQLLSESKAEQLQQAQRKVHCFRKLFNACYRIRDPAFKRSFTVITCVFFRVIKFNPDSNNPAC